jgi:hypothetical protein
MLKKKLKKGGLHLKNKGKKRGHHRVLSTRTCVTVLTARQFVITIEIWKRISAYTLTLS